MSADLVFALLADARLPTGAHAHSAGLEPAVAAGLGVDAVPAFAATRLRTVTATEAGCATVMRHGWLHGGADTVAVEEAWAARTPSAAVRAASRLLGRGLLRLGLTLWPDPLRAAFGDQRDPPRPLVLGVIAAATGLDARRLATVILYEDAQAIASAALKLLPLDPFEAQRWLLSLAPLIDAVSDEVADLSDPADVPARAAPMLDVYAERHARTTRRLFHA